MNKNESIEFLKMLDVVCETLGKPLKTGEAKALYADILGHYGLQNLKGALQAHMRDPERGRFVPTPADIEHQMRIAMQKDGRPTADEAWAIALQMVDEYATVVTNDEIAGALSIASKIMPDRTGARMAFRSAYERIVDANRAAFKKVFWWTSLGRDVQGRESAVLEGIEQGRLKIEAAKLVPIPLKTVENSKNQQIGTGGQKRSEEAKQEIAKLANMLKIKAK